MNEVFLKIDQNLLFLFENLNFLCSALYIKLPKFSRKMNIESLPQCISNGILRSVLPTCDELDHINFSKKVMLSILTSGFGVRDVAVLL